MVKYHTLQRSQCATVAQPVEQLTRNEQVVRSNRISSSKVKSPKSGFAPGFSGIFVWLGKYVSRGMWAVITPVSGKVFQRGGSRGGLAAAEAGVEQERGSLLGGVGVWLWFYVQVRWFGMMISGLGRGSPGVPTRKSGNTLWKQSQLFLSRKQKILEFYSTV